MDSNRVRPAYPLAMKAPEGQVVAITQDLVRQAVEASRASPRKRIILPFHKSDASTLHRMLNAVQPGSYIRPHWHRDPPKDESLILLQGAIEVFIFTDEGQVQQRIRLAAGTHEFGIDLVAGGCHTFIALEPDTVVFEVKPGPYVRAKDKDFASWAPAEGTDQAKEYLARLYEQVQSGP
jgi:cupin fold WbuC family metalloprotein